VGHPVADIAQVTSASRDLVPDGVPLRFSTAALTIVHLCQLACHQPHRCAPLGDAHAVPSRATPDSTPDHERPCRPGAQGGKV
jgi:hypothetical protein